MTNTYSFSLTTPEEIANFDPFDPTWSEYIFEFNAQLLDEDNSKIIRNDAPVGHNITNGPWAELNLGIAEAIIQGGEIKDFKIITPGINYKKLPKIKSIMIITKAKEPTIISGAK